ncbi:hypothetical protein [Actinomadura sp. DC4]|uniref:hypothetical protein n=1 Tax=Actinomadura sp. DC4 TaxID=3055069 RepID=UPI0025AF35F5|nr:hypothetical protein [Actinomadura sp. DC4]MDN3355268.1 hypothetical protein [Actinomadura sp. DC4]
MIVTAPDTLRERIRVLHRTELIHTATRWRPGAEPDTSSAVTRLAMKSIAHRYQQLDHEIKALDGHLQRLTEQAAPDLIAVKGSGAQTVGASLITAGDNAGGRYPPP